MRISAAAVKIRQRRVSWVNNTRQREYFMICTLHAFTRVHPPAFYIFYSSAFCFFLLRARNHPPTDVERESHFYISCELRAARTDIIYLFLLQKTSRATQNEIYVRPDAANITFWAAATNDTNYIISILFLTKTCKGIYWLLKVGYLLKSP
jgi:hypothetical protein